MSLSAISIRTSILLLGALLPSAAASSQSSIALQPQHELQSEARSEGRALILAFEGGLPAAGVAIRIDGETRKTGTDGSISWSLSEGTHRVEVPSIEQKFDLRVRGGEETQALLYLDGVSRSRLEERLPIDRTQIAKGAPLEPALEAPSQAKAQETEVEEYIVLAPRIRGSVSALVEIRRASRAVADVLGSEQISRAGDSDAASSLRRVTGLTLVGGKYVYVRGLGERYSGIAVNGMGLPSPDPSRKVVPLDLFPASMIESVVVQKSFTPDLPAEFGGGLIQLQTRGIPQGPFLKFGLAGALNQESDRLTYVGGKTDWMGFDDGTRAMPAPILEAMRSGKRLNQNNPPFFNSGYSAEDLAFLGKQLKPIYRLDRSSHPIPPGLSLGAGNRWTIGNLGLGASGSMLHSTSSEALEWKSARFDLSGAGLGLSRDESAETESSEVERKSGFSLDLGAQWKKDHEIRVGGLLVRHASDEVKVKEYSKSSDSVSRRRTTSMEWTERELLAGQVSGKHQLPLFPKKPIEFQWRHQRSDAGRSSPDQREYTYLLRDSGAWELNLDTTGNRRSWSDLSEQSTEWGADLAQPFDIDPIGSFKIKVGAAIQRRARRSDTWRLHFRNQMGANPTIDVTKSPEEIFSEGNIGPDGFTITNLTESADSYRATQELAQGYVSAEWSPTPSWTWLSGMRTERSRQIVETFFYYDPNHPTSSAGLEMRDWLPAHALTWRPFEKIQARLAYGETLARPEFRELSTAPFIDDESGYETVGNARLHGTVIRNWDHRWEYYPSPDETFSIGVFKKDFTNPIEQIFEPSPNPRKTFANAESAQNLGVELEGRAGLRHISRSLRNWSVASNFSLIRSRVTLDPESSGIQTSSERPLQGQSPWVANFQVQYDLPSTRTQMTLLYNAVGPRITEVGTSGRPDIYEQPFHQIDFVASQPLTQYAQLGFRARNLLDPEAISTQGDETVRSIRKGRSFYVSLSATF